jgi:nucleoside-diphosphate-sugar epimerase
MKRVFLTGGTGFIGRHVLERLRRLGEYEIIVLTRGNADRCEGVSYVRGDLADQQVLKEVVSEVDFVVHLAGCKKDARKFFETNVIGTRNVLSACGSVDHIKKIIHLSSVGVIGRSAASEIGEQEPCEPSNAYEKSKYEAEMLVRKFSEMMPGKVVILRPTNVFGENDPELHLLNLVRKVGQRRFCYVGKDISRYYLNYVYVKEISELVPALLRNVTESDLYTVNTPTALQEFISTIKEILGDNSPIRHLPYWPTKVAAMCFDMIPRGIISHPPINSVKLLELTNRKMYSVDLLTKELSWKPAFSIFEALRNLISHYGERGLLK